MPHIEHQFLVPLKSQLNYRLMRNKSEKEFDLILLEIFM